MCVRMDHVFIATVKRTEKYDQIRRSKYVPNYDYDVTIV